MNTEIANAVNVAGDKAQYDTRVKRLLAQKSILAHILVKTVDEFKGMKPEDVVKYIEGEPSISVVPVEPGLANMEKTDATGQRIVGLNTENAEINEGLVRFDIIFYVRMPSIVGRKNGLSQIIVNIEAQKDEPTEYKIVICITKISTFLILCDLAVCLATLYVSFSLVFALMRYLQGKVFLIRFYSPTTLSSSRAEFRLPSRLACA